jgi:predicted RNA binding protein YcfA (HicA-like mRNA interferase family)
MPKRVREVIKAVEEAGWVFARQGGTSHRQYKHPERPGVVTISGNPGDEMALGTYNNIMKVAGLKKA